MRPDTLFKALATYVSRFNTLGILPESYAGGALTPLPADAMRHAHWMCVELARMALDPANRDKVNRWLGFAQGVLWVTGLYSIDEMREHNRDPKSEP